MISNVVGPHPSGSCASRRITLSRGELVGLDDPAGQHHTTGLEPLTHDLQAEFVKTAERAQIRAHEGSVRRVAAIRHPPSAIRA